MRALESLSLDDQEKIGAILTVSQHVAASVELEQNLAEEGSVEVSPEGVEVLKEVITAERFPHLVPLLESGAYVAGAEPAVPEDETGVEAEYDLGLDLIISGLEVLERTR